MDINLITNYKNGLKNNFEELYLNKMYQQNHSGSKFKYLYEESFKDTKLRDKWISSIIAYNIDNIPIGVLFFIHNEVKDFRKYEIQDGQYIFRIIGKIGIFVKPEYRNKGLAKKLLREFENNFIDLYYKDADYIVVSALEDAYEVSFKSFKWIIPNNRPNSEDGLISSIKKSILENKVRSMRYYEYRKKTFLP